MGSLGELDGKPLVETIVELFHATTLTYTCGCNLTNHIYFSTFYSGELSCLQPPKSPPKCIIDHGQVDPNFLLLPLEDRMDFRQVLAQINYYMCKRKYKYAMASNEVECTAIYRVDQLACRYGHKGRLTPARRRKKKKKRR